MAILLACLWSLFLSQLLKFTPGVLFPDSLLFFLSKNSTKRLSCVPQQIFVNLIYLIENFKTAIHSLLTFQYSKNFNISASKQELSFMFTYLGENLVNSIKLRGARPAVDETLTNFLPPAQMWRQLCDKNLANLSKQLGTEFQEKFLDILNLNHFYISGRKCVFAQMISQLDWNYSCHSTPQNILENPDLNPVFALLLELLPPLLWLCCDKSLL